MTDARKADTAAHLEELERATSGKTLALYRAKGLTRPTKAVEPEDKDEKEKRRLENIAILAEMMTDKELLEEFDTWEKRAIFFDVATDTIKKWFRSKEFNEAVVQFLVTLSALAVAKATPGLADKAMAGNIKAFEALSRNANPKNQALQQKTELNQTNINLNFDGLLRELSQRKLPHAINPGISSGNASGEAALPEHGEVVEGGPGTLLRHLPEDSGRTDEPGSLPVQHGPADIPSEGGETTG